MNELNVAAPEYSADEVSLSCSWTQHAVNPAETIMNADHAPAQPAVDLNNRTIHGPTPIADQMHSVEQTLNPEVCGAPSLLGNCLEAMNNLGENIADARHSLSGGPQPNNTTQPVQQITASIDDGPQIKVNDSVTGFQNNFSTPNIA